MVILGINAYHGDVSAVLLRDGKLIAAVEEERFRRVKHWAGFPGDSIVACLQMAKIRAEDVDHFAVSRNPRANIFRKVWYTLRKRPSLNLIRGRLSNMGRVNELGETIARHLDLDPRSVEQKLHWIEHHPAHLASAFFVSRFEDAAVCAIDGFGDFVSTSFAIGRHNTLRVLDRVYFPHSLGQLYLAVTQFLGFPKYGDEYKVMGLAPYGVPDFVGELRRLIRLKPQGKFELISPTFGTGPRVRV